MAKRQKEQKKESIAIQERNACIYATNSLESKEQRTTDSNKGACLKGPSLAVVNPAEGRHLTEAAAE